MPTTTRRMVDFHLFLTQFWPKVKQIDSASSISASAVYTEINSFIRGSNRALDPDMGGRLSLDEYLKLPKKMSPLFAGIGEDESTEDAGECWPRFHRLSPESTCAAVSSEGSRRLVYDIYLKCTRLLHTFLTCG